MGKTRNAIVNLRNEINKRKNNGESKTQIYNNLVSLGYNKWPNLQDTVGITYDALDNKSHAVLCATYSTHTNWHRPHLSYLTNNNDFTSVISLRDAGEFRANTYILNGQTRTSVAGLSTGGFVITWQSPQDADEDGVFGQRYDSEHNAVGSEFQINTYTTGNQERPAVASLLSGAFVVVWQSNGQDGNSFGIYGQRYDSSGTKIGSEFQVNTYTTGSQEIPAVASLPSGAFVVIWQSNGQDGNSFGIYGQRYDSSGTKIGNEFQVNTYTTGNQFSPAIATFSDESFVVVWQSNGQDGDSLGIYGQRYDLNGNTVGSEFQINTYSTDNQRNPSVTTSSDGGFLVTWESEGQDGDLFGIYGQLFDSNSDKVNDEFQINEYTTSSQLGSHVAYVNNAWYVVTWFSVGQDGSSFGVYGKVYHKNGDVLLEEFQVNEYTLGSQFHPSIDGLSDGGFVVAWQGQGANDPSGIFSNVYDIV